MHDGVVIGKVVRHGLDRLLDGGLVSAFGGDDEAFAQMLLTGCQHRLAPGANGGNGGFLRDGVLHALLDAGNTADRIGMPLADALAPEGVAVAIRQGRFGNQAQGGKEAGVPADGDGRRRPGLFRGGINGGEIFGDAGMRIETVNGVEQRGQTRPLFGQVGRRTAAENQHIDLALERGDFGFAHHGHTGRRQFQGSRIAPRDHGGKLHIGILPQRQFNAPANIAITNNTYRNFCVHFG